MKSSQKYHPVTKYFHWIVVFLLAVEFGIGWLMPDIRRGTTPEGLISYHMSFGIFILLVMLMRLVARFIQPAPGHAPGMSRLQELAASWAHYLLYATVALLPITGWWLASAHGWTVSMFSVFTLPALVSNNATLPLADIAHVGLVVVVVGLIGLHTVAALYHHYIVKDQVLKRML